MNVSRDLEKLCWIASMIKAFFTQNQVEVAKPSPNISLII